MDTLAGCSCSGCEHWVIRVVTRYEDGSEVINQEAPPGRGNCSILGISTDPGFACIHYKPDPEAYSHVIVAATKSGAPWQHSHAGPCPDCSGAGTGCSRCQGTGKVRHYEDGFIGEERTRLHPKERELAAKPRCAGCGGEVERDWRVCPKCGAKLDAESSIEVVDGLSVT